MELLTDKDSRDCISWVGEEGEFKLNQPELVAQKWGQRKNKPTMNYEKLSRALRFASHSLPRVHWSRDPRTSRPLDMSIRKKKYESQSH